MMIGHLQLCQIKLNYKMIVSQNEVYQIVKKSCISEKIYEDWADDIGKAIAFLHKNNIDGCNEFVKLISVLRLDRNLAIKKEKNQLIIKNLDPIRNAIPIIDWLISGNNKTTIISNQIISPLIFFSLLANTCKNYGGTFNISNKKEQILYKINVNFKFFKINKLKGYFIIKWYKSNKFLKTIKIKKRVHGVTIKNWKYLELKANKTYVPETIISRNSGAGAGLLDND